MAIAPNTTFVANTVLTASQQNAFGFGIVALGTNAVASAAVSAETLSVTSNSFTAIANRYYKITYFEPTILYSTGTVSYVDLNIRLTSIAGTLKQNSSVLLSSANRNSGTVSIVTTLTAGATVVVGCFDPEGGGTATAFRSASNLSYIIVEDVGPA